MYIFFNIDLIKTHDANICWATKDHWSTDLLLNSNDRRRIPTWCFHIQSARRIKLEGTLAIRKASRRNTGGRTPNSKPGRRRWGYARPSRLSSQCELDGPALRRYVACWGRRNSSKYVSNRRDTGLDGGRRARRKRPIAGSSRWEARGHSWWRELTSLLHLQYLDLYCLCWLYFSWEICNATT